MSRKKYVVGNWKMNQSLADIESFFSAAKEVTDCSCEAWIAPQAVHIPLVQGFASDGKIKVGAQNCANNEKGAFTGEISPVTLKELGVDFTLVGHSERRAIYNETDQLLNEKAILALNSGLTVIFCVGETLEEREANKTFDIVKGQITKGLKDIPKDKLANLLVAYEPVWAIGTGKTASPEQAQEVHAYIRDLNKEVLGSQAGEATPILYGGSVKPSNVKELLSCKDIDGGLVGGASLKGSDYTQLCQGAQ